MWKKTVGRRSGFISTRAYMACNKCMYCCPWQTLPWRIDLIPFAWIKRAFCFPTRDALFTGGRYTCVRSSQFWSLKFARIFYSPTCNLRKTLLAQQTSPSSSPSSPSLPRRAACNMMASHPNNPHKGFVNKELHTHALRRLTTSVGLVATLDS